MLKLMIRLKITSRTTNYKVQCLHEMSLLESEYMCTGGEVLVRECLLMFYLYLFRSFTIFLVSFATLYLLFYDTRRHLDIPL